QQFQLSVVINAFVVVLLDAKIDGKVVPRMPGDSHPDNEFIGIAAIVSFQQAPLQPETIVIPVGQPEDTGTKRKSIKIIAAYGSDRHDLSRAAVDLLFP